MPTFRQDEKLGTKVPLIKTADINDRSVTTEKLSEGSVTNSKLAPESVTQDKFDKELLQIFKAAAGLPENLIETIQNVDSTLVDHQRQISSNDDDISDLQTKTKQIKDTVDGIAVSGGASVGSAVTYDNTQSGLDALNIQNAIDELVNNLGHYETNEEWLRAYTDAENKFLWGIRVDGSIDWAVGIPKPIQKAINEIIANSETFQQTLTEAMEAYKATIDEKVAAIDEKKVDKEEGKSLIEDEVKERFRVIENEEFIKAVVDSEDRVLFGFYRATGKPYFPLNEMYHVEQNEEFLWIILDAANHPLLGIQQDGTCWAAKAQWLDDIKAIKEALKTFQPKEDGKGLINLDVADSFFYISNDEYIIAVVDAENRILAGIKYDAQPYFPNHEMYSVVTNEEWLYAIIDAENKVLGGFRADDGHMIVGGIDISTFISNAIIDIQDIKERTTHLSTIENDEYLSVETDAEGKVIGYIAPDGSHYLYKVKSETIPTEFEHIEDPEGRTEITTDADNRVLGYRDVDGTRHEHSFSSEKLSCRDIDFGKKAIGKVSNIALSAQRSGNIRKFNLPKYGTVNIKEETFYLTANDGYTDKDGIYPIVINEDTPANAQKGLTVLKFFVKSSLTDNGDGTYSQKEDSIGLDFYVPAEVSFIDSVPYVTKTLEYNSVDSSYSVKEDSVRVTKIVDVPTIGAWTVNKKTEHQCVVEIDFGHYLSGTFCIGVKYQGSSTLSYMKRNFRFTFYKDSSYSKKDKIKLGEMIRTSGFNLKANFTDATRIKENLMNRILIAVWENRENYKHYPWDNEDIPYNGAVGMIKGFPIRVNIGDKFYGLDIFGLKKDEKNFMLDGDDTGMIVSGTRGNYLDLTNWTAAKPEDWEDEMNDELTDSNKNALSNFFTFINSADFTKDNIPQKMSVLDWIDYFINLQVFLMRDNTCRNMMLYSGKDKVKMYPFFYDLDLSWLFDESNFNLDIMKNSYAADMSLWENFKNLYWDEIINRYAYLRKNIFSESYITAVYNDIVCEIPDDDVSLEDKKWKNIGWASSINPKFMLSNIAVLEKRLEWLDNNYFKI